jgi:hypothetical protein
LIKNVKGRAPPVGTYTIKDGLNPAKIHGIYKCTMEKSNAAIDEAIYHSM